MTLRRQAMAWGAAAAATVAALYLLSGVLLPFVAALALGYLLDPVADRLERMGMSRLWATLTILLVFTALAVVVIGLAAPVLMRQFASFVSAFPDLAAKAQQVLIDKGGEWLKALEINLTSILGFDPLAGNVDAQNVVPDMMKTASQWLLGVMRSVLSGGAAILNLASLLVVTPVVAFYILLDWDRMVERIDANIPPRDRAKVKEIAAEIDRAMAGFLRGQSLLCLFLGLWYGIGLSLIGVNYGFLIGVIGGVLSFIPYVGSLTVLVLSLIVAIAQSWPSLSLPAMALGVFAVGQFLEGNILSPRLVGESVGLHPVWVMFALMAGGALFGFVGLLVAVPVAAALGVLTRHALDAYRTSAFFTAGAPPDEPAA
jgi:predicted PurR-regulated permease PerM